MPKYITFPKMPDSIGVGRTAFNAAIDPATGEYVCEVEEVRDGEQETTAEHHAAVVSAAEVESRKPAPVPPPRPDPDVELANAIEAATDLASLKAALLGNKGAGMVKGRPV